MPGSIFFKPIQCQFSKSNFQDPYVFLDAHNQVLKSKRAKHDGDNLVWDKDSEPLELKVNMGGDVTLLLRDADKKEPNDEIGNFKIDLDILESKGSLCEWFDIYDKKGVIGKIQLEGTFKKDKVHGMGQNIKGFEKEPYIPMKADYTDQLHNNR